MKTKSITIRVNNLEYKILKREAEEAGINISILIRYAIGKWYNSLIDLNKEIKPDIKKTNRRVVVRSPRKTLQDK